MTTEHHIGLIGRIGAGEVVRQPLDEADTDYLGGIVALAPDGRGLRVTSDATWLQQPSWAGLLSIGPQPRESRVWRVDRERQPQFIAALPAHATCHLVGRDLASAVCIGTERSRSLIWRFDVATAPAAPLIVPGRTWRSGVSRDGRMVGLWTANEVLLVDLDVARASRWTMSADAGYPIDLVPAADRLIALTYSTSGASVGVYDARWHDPVSARPEDFVAPGPTAPRAATR